MNQLSWLLYWADVSASSEGWLIFFGIAAMTVIVIMIGISVVSSDAGQDPPKAVGAVIGWSIASIVFCVLASALLPSRETVYAIAASELGEQVLNSETGQRAGRALNSWIDDQIGGEKKPAETE